MPSARLPTTLKGWIAAGISSFIGFFAGFYSLKVMEDLWK